MKTMLKIMRMRKNEIPDDILPLFEHIVQTYKGEECEEKFIKLQACTKGNVSISGIN